MPACWRQKAVAVTPLAVTSQRCRCGSCGDFFNSVTAFDGHRVGPYRQLRDSPHAVDRRCLAPDEMTARGWQRNASGYWTTGTMPATAFPVARQSGNGIDPATSARVASSSPPAAAAAASAAGPADAESHRP